VGFPMGSDRDVVSTMRWTPCTSAGVICATATHPGAGATEQDACSVLQVGKIDSGSRSGIVSEQSTDAHAIV
jgi:hypothetical protein